MRVSGLRFYATLDDCIRSALYQNVVMEIGLEMHLDWGLVRRLSMATGSATKNYEITVPHGPDFIHVGTVSKWEGNECNCINVGKFIGFRTGLCSKP